MTIASGICHQKALLGKAFMEDGWESQLGTILHHRVQVVAYPVLIGFNISFGRNIWPLISLPVIKVGQNCLRLPISILKRFEY